MVGVPGGEGKTLAVRRPGHCVDLCVFGQIEGRLGTTIQKVVQFCFSYDAENKTYVFNLLRVSGTVVLLTAFAFLAFLIFGGKKKKREN